MLGDLADLFFHLGLGNLRRSPLRRSFQAASHREHRVRPATASAAYAILTNSSSTVFRSTPRCCRSCAKLFRRFLAWIRSACSAPRMNFPRSILRSRCFGAGRRPPICIVSRSALNFFLQVGERFVAFVEALCPFVVHLGRFRPADRFDLRFVMDRFSGQSRDEKSAGYETVNSFSSSWSTPTRFSVNAFSITSSPSFTSRSSAVIGSPLDRRQRCLREVRDDRSHRSPISVLDRYQMQRVPCQPVCDQVFDLAVLDRLYCDALPRVLRISARGFGHHLDVNMQAYRL